MVRLHQVSYSFQAHKETGRAVSARRLAGIAGFAPTTFHALGSRVAAAEARRGFHLSVTNVPGPQFPLYAAGAEMVETYPVHPLLPDHTLAVGVTSYNGGVFYGITADRDAVPDVDTLGQCLLEALDELDGVGQRRPQARAPRVGGRREGVRSVRVYLPTTLDLLARFDAEGVVPVDADPITAEDESEEAEYAALMTAADASAELLAGRGSGRRVVLVAEVADGARSVPVRLVASVHVDTEDDADPDDDLAWYATQEIPELIAGR